MLHPKYLLLSNERQEKRHFIWKNYCKGVTNCCHRGRGTRNREKPPPLRCVCRGSVARWEKTRLERRGLVEEAWSVSLRECFAWGQPIFLEGSFRKAVCLLRLRVGLGEGKSLNQRVVNKYFVPIWQKRSANHLWGKERAFGRTVSGLVWGRQGVIHQTSLSHMGKGRSLQSAIFQDTKVGAITQPLLFSRIQGSGKSQHCLFLSPPFCPHCQQPGQLPLAVTWDSLCLQAPLFQVSSNLPSEFFSAINLTKLFSSKSRQNEMINKPDTQLRWFLNFLSLSRGWRNTL